MSNLIPRLLILPSFLWSIIRTTLHDIPQECHEVSSLFLFTSDIEVEPRCQGTLRDEISVYLITCNPGACFSKVPKLFGPISGATIAFIYIFATPRFYAIKLRNPLGFSYSKNMLKDQIFKTNELPFDIWLLGPEKFSGLSRNRPLDIFVQTMISLVPINLGQYSWNTK